MMSLNDYISSAVPVKKKQVPLKGALRKMRGLWFKGEQSRFDAKLVRVYGCSIEKAEQIREEWICMGFLGYNRRGLLKWRTRSF